MSDLQHEVWSHYYCYRCQTHTSCVGYEKAECLQCLVQLHEKTVAEAETKNALASEDEQEHS